MEEQLISSANLNAIEDNLDYVAKELSGVITNVNSVNEQINSIEENISNLNDELGNLVKEIRETTIINNARQSIMYNNEQIEKKYGYFDIVRRRTESLISAINSSKVNKQALLNMKEDLLLNNPNYWLSNALIALLSWVINDKENTSIELKNAMQKNREKTCVFFCLVNLKLARFDTAIRWLESYLNNEDPTNLSRDFITILDLVSNNEFGNEGKRIIIDKINIWLNRISININIEKEEVNKWEKYIKSKEDENIALPFHEVLSKEIYFLKKNLTITSSYKNILSELKYITEKKYENKTLDNILNSLIYDYEKEEQVYQKDNLKNKLIIENNGDREKAIQIYEEEKNIYEENINILSLLNNIVIYNNQYKVNDETRKLALSLIKNNILSAYSKINNEINKNNYYITIEDFNLEVNDELSDKFIEDKINEYVERKYEKDDKQAFIILAIVNLLIIIIILFSLKISWLCFILFISLILFDIYFSYKHIYKPNKLSDIQKKDAKTRLTRTLQSVLAESIDYKNMLKQNEQDFNEMKIFLNSINTKNYIRSNNERSIDIDE